MTVHQGKGFTGAKGSGFAVTDQEDLGAAGQGLIADLAVLDGDGLRIGGFAHRTDATFGELSVFDPQRRSATSEATGEAEMVGVPFSGQPARRVRAAVTALPSAWPRVAFMI